MTTKQYLNDLKIVYKNTTDVDVKVAIARIVAQVFHDK